MAQALDPRWMKVIWVFPDYMKTRVIVQAEFRDDGEAVFSVAIPNCDYKDRHFLAIT
jgi:hypothetical protein